MTHRRASGTSLPPQVVDAVHFGPIQIDESALPLVVVRIRGVATASEFRRYVLWLDQLLERRIRHGLVLDTRGAGDTPIDQRKAFGKWMNERRDEVERDCARIGFVVDGVLGRMVLRSIMLLTRSSVATRVFADREEAEEWVLAGLHEMQ